MAAEQPKTEAKPAAEKQTNCLGCNKPLKKLRRYYRNTKFYCTRRCYKNALAKAKEKEGKNE